MSIAEIHKQKSAQVIDIMNEKKLGITEALDIVGLTYYHFTKCMNQYPEMQSHYDSARKNIAHHLAHEIIRIADGDDNPHKARNRIDARKWLASKNNSAVYGDKIDVTVESKVDLSSALDAARKRAAIAVSASVVLDQSLRVDGNDGDDSLDELDSLDSSDNYDQSANTPDSSEIDDMLS